MIDSGADVNLIKIGCLNSSTSFNKFHNLILQGISSKSITTLGSTNILIFGKETEFHLVPDDTPFPQHGILGTGFLRAHNAILDFQNKCLAYNNTCIPFAEATSVLLQPRSVTPFQCYITNPEMKTGYIPPQKCEKGIYLGDAIVTNSKGKAYLPIFNTTEQTHKVDIPAVVLQEFDTLDTLDESTGVAEATTGLCVDSSSTFYNVETHFDTQDSRRDAKLSCGASGSRGLPLVSGRSGNFNISTTSNRADSILQLLRTEHLNSEEKDSLTSLISEHAERFYLPSDHLGCTNAATHCIPTTNEVPIHKKQYRFPPIHKDEINKQVDSLLKDDLIEYSTSPYNSPIWIVPKKPDSMGNKRWRMVIDYRALNEKTIGDAYPLPNIADILDQLGNAKYFSVLDLASGFHQIPMEPSDAPKTAFSTPYGHYQFKRMPFGLKNAPATFQRLMDNVLSGLQGNELFVYMDDIVIYSRSLEEHAVKFNRLMKRLKDANLKLQPDKCEFLRTEVAYLGHIIGSDGVKPDPRKIEAITKFPQPRNAKNIKQFLGLVGYYRRFIPQFSKIAKPLTDLLKKDKPFSWQNAQADAFSTLQNYLCLEPILQYPDFTQPFILTTDASGYAIGGVLSQGKIGKDLPIAYVSRILNKAEQNYSTIEKECLAIVYCTHYFRPYLYGRKFTIITDHKPLVWLHSIKDPSSRLWKWRTKLEEYEYEIQYKKGSLNNNADALSRNPPSAIMLPFTTENNNDSSDGSLFSFPKEPPHERPPRKPNIITNPILPDSNIPSTSTQLSPPIPRETDYERINEDANEPYFSFESDTEDESDDETDSLFLADTIPINRRNEDTNVRLNIISSRESLLKQRDNIVIFICQDGAPFDNGARELSEAGLLPNYRDIMYERAKVTSLKGKTLIALPIKLDNQTLIEVGNIKNCMQSLSDVVKDLDLESFSIRQTNMLDEIPWFYLHNQLIKYLKEFPLNITICKNLIRIPDEAERLPLILENHSSAIGGHKGVTKTYNRLRPHYYWNTMKKDIQAFIQKCRQCQLRKLTRIKTKSPMIITDTPGTAFEKISLDIMGPLPTSTRGYSYILTMQDLLTKYSVAVPLIEANSMSIADAFTKNFICIYGAPKAILTDQGTNFLSSLMRNLTKRFNIKHFKTTAYHPQSNGSLERSHHVLTEYLKNSITNDKEWDEHVALAMFSYNTSVHESTQYSPFQLVFGRLARTPSSHPPIEEEDNETYQQYLADLFNKLRDTQDDARKHLIASKERSKRYYDRHIHPYQFNPGDNVFLLKEPRKGKFDDQYTGPYKILDILPHNNARILFRNKPRIVHMDKLKLAHIDPG